MRLLKSRARSRRLLVGAFAGLAVMLLAGCSSPQAPSTMAPPPEPGDEFVCDTPEPLAWGLPVSSASQGLAPIAVERGYFEDWCVDGSAQLVQGTQNTIASLISGDVKIMNGDGINLLRAFSQGLDIRILAVPTTVPLFELVSTTDITELADLEGKRIGITALGNSTQFQLQKALETVGLADEDVEYIALSDYGGIYAALEAGQVDAGMLVVPFTEQMYASGRFHELVDLSTLDGASYPGSVVATTQTMLDRNPGLIVRALAAYVEAYRGFASDEEGTVQGLSVWLQQTDTDILTATYLDLLDKYREADPTAIPGDFEVVLDYIATVENTVLDVDLTVLVQPQYLEQAVDLVNSRP